MRTRRQQPAFQKTTTHMNRIELLDKIFPFCEPAKLCIGTLSGDKIKKHWIYNKADVDRALSAWRKDELHLESFNCIGINGPYVVNEAMCAGVVPHVGGCVGVFVVDLDNHKGQKDCTIYDRPLAKFFQVEPVRFRSHGGKGIHQFYFLANSMPVEDFKKWSKSWGFNRNQRPEIFPKTDKLVQVWLPNNPNKTTGGDAFIPSEGWNKNEFAILPDLIPTELTDHTLDFLCGFINDSQELHTAIFIAAKSCCEKWMAKNTAHDLIVSRAVSMGKERGKAESQFKQGWEKGTKERPALVPIAEGIQTQIKEVFSISGISIPEKLRQIGFIATNWLLTKGRLYHTSERTFDSAMFFDENRKLLLPVNSDCFQGWLSESLGANRKESVYTYAFTEIQTQGLGSRSVLVEPSYYWESKNGNIYISNGPGHVIKITSKSTELVDNGTDGVLFCNDGVLSEWNHLATPVDPFETCECFSNMSTSTLYGKLLFKIWALSLSSNPSKKPPILLTGTKGSGKTRTIEGLEQLYGTPVKLSQLKVRDGERDFWVDINLGGLCCFDNVDSKDNSWFASALESAATAGTQEKAKHYENKAQVSMKARAWIAITSANPVFASDLGMSDRLIVIRMKRRTQTADSSLAKEIEKNRDAGLAWIAQTLQKALAQEGNASAELNINKRHPDFARFAIQIGLALGEEKEVVAALREAEQDKSCFTIENHPIGKSLEELLRMEGFKGTAADMLKCFSRNEICTDDYLNSKKLGAYLNNNWGDIEIAYKAKRHYDTHNRKWIFDFLCGSVVIPAANRIRRCK